MSSPQRAAPHHSQRTRGCVYLEFPAQLGKKANGGRRGPKCSRGAMVKTWAAGWRPGYEARGEGLPWLDSGGLSQGKWPGAWGQRSLRST